MKKITIKSGLLEGKERLKLHFDYDKEIIALVKTIPGARWDPKEKCWHVATQAGPVDKLNRLFEGKLHFEMDGKTVGREDDETVGREDGKTVRREDRKTVRREDGRTPSPVRDSILVEKTGHSSIESRRDGIMVVPDEFIKTLTLKNYAQNTIRTYKSMLQEFLTYYKKLDPGKITEEQIRDYLLYLIEERDVSISYQNQSINAIKFYYEQILGRPVRTYYIQRPKKPKVLPNVLSEEEVQLILNNVDNLKHKCILSLAYSAGLRLGEVINLKPGDIDSKRNYVIVRQGKGMKDRYSLLSGKILELLRKYYAEYKPKEWLFEGQFGGPYSATSIHNILKAAVDKAGIKKRVTVHTLRHSFATHLLEHGVDIRYIQTLLGHQSSRTTEIYTHITDRGLGKIKSPLDNLDI
jgi:integrase/recombinase XerD